MLLNIVRFQGLGLGHGGRGLFFLPTIDTTNEDVRNRHSHNYWQEGNWYKGYVIQQYVSRFKINFQYIHISKHYVAHLKIIQCNMSILLQYNWKKINKNKHLNKCTLPLIQQFHFENLFYRYTCIQMKWRMSKIIYCSNVCNKRLETTQMFINRKLIEWMVVQAYKRVQCRNLKESPRQLRSKN